MWSIRRFPHPPDLRNHLRSTGIRKRFCCISEMDLFVTYVANKTTNFSSCWLSFNPFEKYARQIGSFPQVVVKKKETTTNFSFFPCMFGGETPSILKNQKEKKRQGSPAPHAKMWNTLKAGTYQSGKYQKTTIVQGSSPLSTASFWGSMFSGVCTLHQLRPRKKTLVGRGFGFLLGPWRKFQKRTLLWVFSPNLRDLPILSPWKT